MKYYDPELGVVLPERSYAEACDLSWDNIKVSKWYSLADTWILISL